MTEPLLELDGVTKQFGSLTAVDDVSFAVTRDDSVAMIGPNGAGKTTTFNLISGKFPPTSGRIRFDGRDVTDCSPAERSNQGIGRSFQISNIFPQLTVRENVRVPVIARSEYNANLLTDVEDIEEINDATAEYMRQVDLEHLADRKAEELSFGQQRRVELGITLASDPKLVLLDEPTAGMNPSRTSETVRLIEDVLVETGLPFIIVEHDIDVAFELAESVVVLHHGSVLAEGSPVEVRQNEDVQSAYLG